MLNRNNENAMLGADTFPRIENSTRRNYSDFNPRAPRERRRSAGNCHLLRTFAIISVRRIYIAYGRNWDKKETREKKGGGALRARSEIAYVALSAPGRS